MEEIKVIEEATSEEEVKDEDQALTTPDMGELLEI